jgi:hypothetical protein
MGEGRNREEERRMAYVGRWGRRRRVEENMEGER